MNVRIYGPDTAELHTIKTQVVGTNWSTLPDIKCRAVTIFNTTGVSLLVKYTQQAAVIAPDLGYMTLPDGASRTFGGLKIPNEARSAKALAIKRKDSSNVQLDVEFEAESV